MHNNIKHEPGKSGPLAGVRVLDLSRALAGPWCTQNLADLGAEVIKIERPKTGDESRQWGPPWLADGDGEPTSESAYFLATNRNKKSVAIDLAQPSGQQLIQRLVEQSDVLVENFKVGNLARYKLDWESLSKINPSLIYCSITGFGQEGPYAKYPGYDYLFQGLGGVMSVTGDGDDIPGSAPQRVGLPIVDLFTGMYADVAILSALHHRTATGEGQQIDISLLDCVLAMGAGQISNYFVGGKIPTRTGNAAPNIAPYEIFTCSDGEMIIACANQSQFESLCRVMDRPQWSADERFKSNSARVANRVQLRELLLAVFKQKSRNEWESVLLAAGVPCGPINDYEQALAHPQAQHRGVRVEMPHPLGGTAPGVANPMRFSSAAQVEYWRAPPLLGQDTREVLSTRLQLTEDDLNNLETQGVIAGTVVDANFA